MDIFRKHHKTLTDQSETALAWNINMNINQWWIWRHGFLPTPSSHSADMRLWWTVTTVCPFTFPWKTWVGSEPQCWGLLAYLLGFGSDTGYKEGECIQNFDSNHRCVKTVVWKSKFEIVPFVTIAHFSSATSWCFEWDHWRGNLGKQGDFFKIPN